MGKKRGRPRRRSKVDSDRECESDPTWSPKGSLSAPIHHPTSPSEYTRLHQKEVFGQCATLTTPTGYPIRNANGYDSTLKPVKNIIVQKTESSSPNQVSPTTVDIPTTDNLTSILPFQTQGFLSVPAHFPPAPSQRPKRCGKEVVGQCDILTTRLRYPLRSAKGAASHDSSLTPAKKILTNTTDSLSPTAVHIPNMGNSYIELPFQTQVSNNPAAAPLKSEDRSLLYLKWLEDGGETIENLNDLMDIEQLSSDHQIHAQEKLHVTAAPANPTPPPPYEIVFQNHLANMEASNVVGNGQEEVFTKNLGQKAAPTQSHSLNLTEMAAMSCDNSSDDEVHSAFSVPLVTVNGYRVKEEFASLLREILSKFGDIAKESTLESERLRSFLLETVCQIFQTLQGTTFTEITSVDLKSMLDDIDGIESVRVEVGWLRKRVEEIKEAKLLQKGSSSLKGEKTRINEAIGKAEREVEGYKVEMKTVQEKISLVEGKLARMKSDFEKINGLALDTTTKVKCFYKKSLVDGLL